MDDVRPNHLLDSTAGPPLLAYVIEGVQPFDETAWRSRVRGQFLYVESGLVCVRTDRGVWALTPHRVGWMPPNEPHTVRVIEPIRGWGVFVTPAASAGMPNRPCVLRGNDLMRALVHRAAGWNTKCHLVDGQQRVMGVLMDEMQLACVPDEPLQLPMPSDHRLLRVAQALLAHPGDTRSLAQWAHWAGLSTRNASRLFRSETGCSFTQWRQQARLTRALEYLGNGETVTHVADALGYGNVSAFVAMFRRSFGQSPGRYLKLGTP